MKRRLFLLGALALGCTPTKSGEAEPEEEPPQPEGETPLRPDPFGSRNPQLVVAEWTSMMTGSSIALYSDGLIDHRWTEFVEDGAFGEYIEHFRVAMADPSDMMMLHKTFAPHRFVRLEPSYHEDGVLDGGAVTLSHYASGRRITVVNEPADLPSSLGFAIGDLERLAARAKNRGADPFTSVPGPGRMLLVHEFQAHADRSFVFTVFESGHAELRLIADPNGPADDAHDQRTPQSRVTRVDAQSLGTLRQAIGHLQKNPPSEADLRGKRGAIERLRLRNPKREIVVPVGFSPPKTVERVIEESRALAGEIWMR